MDKEKLLAAVERLRHDLARVEDQVGVVEALLAGELTPGQVAKGLIGDFVIAWGKAYKGQTYHVDNWPAAMAKTKKLLKELSADEIRKRMALFVASRESFYVNARHPLMMFFAAVNKLGGDGDLLDDKYKGAEEVDEPPI